MARLHIHSPTMHVCTDFMLFLTSAGHVPYDGEPREEFVTIMAPITAIFMILNISGIIYAVVCFMFNAIFHKKRYLIPCGFGCIHDLIFALLGLFKLTVLILTT